MAVSATVSPGIVLVDGTAITISDLNKLGTPTVDISGAVGSLSISTNSINNSHIQSAAAIQYDKLEALATGELVVGNAGTATATTLDGDATIAADGELTIVNDAVTTVKILNANVTTAKLADSTGASDGVTTAKLATGAVTGPKIAMTSDAQGDILIRGSSNYERLATGTENQVLTAGGAGANPTWEDSASGSQTVLTSGTTWTNSTNAKIIHVRLFGGGGGQGGGDNYLQVSDGKLGGRGASVTAVLDVSGETSVTYAIGSGGSGGAMGANNGSAGGDSTFGSNLTAGGGAGGGHYGGSVGANGSITTTEATAIDSTSDALRVVGKITYGISVAGVTTEGNGADGTNGAVVITVLG